MPFFGNFVSMLKDEHTYVIKLLTMYQSRDIGLDILYCCKWRKMTKSCHDLYLEQTMPNVETRTRTFNILQYVEVSGSLTHCYTHTHTHTHTHTARQTDGHEYSIVAVDKPKM